MKYRRNETKNGRIQYWATNEDNKYRMVGKKEIPDDILERLDKENEVDTDVSYDATVAIRPEDRKCFIDGEPGKFKKFLEQKTVYLCEEHQHSLTTGEIVWHMRQQHLLDDE